MIGRDPGVDFLSASTAWIGASALAMTAALPLLFRRTARGPRFLRHHQQLATVALAATGAHLLLSVLGRQLAAPPAAGLLLGGLGAAAIVGQVLLGRRLRKTGRARRSRLKAIHRRAMLAVGALALLHIATTADTVPSRSKAEAGSSSPPPVQRAAIGPPDGGSFAGLEGRSNGSGSVRAGGRVLFRERKPVRCGPQANVQSQPGVVGRGRCSGRSTTKRGDDPFRDQPGPITSSPRLHARRERHRQSWGAR